LQAWRCGGSFGDLIADGFDVDAALVILMAQGRGLWRRRAVDLVPERMRLWLRRRQRASFNTGRQVEWEQRAEDAVSLWTDTCGEWAQSRKHLAIGDFGAGNERLRKILAAAPVTRHDYYPYDLIPQEPTTEHLDVLDGLPPRQFDLVFCLGLLEYIPLENPFLSRLRASCRYAVLSYVVTDSPLYLTQPQREAAGWVTHLSSQDLEGRLQRNGFTILSRSRTDGDRTGLWVARSDSESEWAPDHAAKG
jgi:hypothetical protein